MARIKKYIFSKKFIYVLCFIALNVIDVMRDAQFVSLEVQNKFLELWDIFPGYRIGDIWLIVANCAGIMMMFILFSAYSIRKFCTVSNGIWTCLCVVFMSVIPFIRTGEHGTILIQEELAIFNMWWIGILVKCFIYRIFVEKSVKIKLGIVAAIWIAMTVFMITSEARAKFWPLQYFLMFGMFYITEFKKDDIKDLFDALIDGSIIAFFIMQTGAFFLRPFDDLRYQGIHSNWNMSGLYYLIIFTMCLCKLHVLELRQAGKMRKIFYLAIAGAVLVLEFMTGCRTAWIVNVLLVLIYGIFVVKKNWGKKWKQVIGRGAILVATMIVAFLPVFMMARCVPMISPARVWYVGEMELYAGLDKSMYSTRYTTLEYFFTRTFSRLALMIPSADKQENVETEDTSKQAEQVQTNEAETTAPSVQSPTNIDSPKITNAKIPSWITEPSMQNRFRVYSAFLHDMTWRGNGPDAELARNAYHSHNLFIQIGYFYGIPAGILLIVLMVALLIRNYKHMMKQKNNPYAIMPLLFTVLFFAFGMLEVVWNTGQFILFLIFFVQFPFKEETIN